MCVQGTFDAKISGYRSHLLFLVWDHPRRVEAARISKTKKDRRSRAVYMKARPPTDIFSVRDPSALYDCHDL